MGLANNLNKSFSSTDNRNLWTLIAAVKDFKDTYGMSLNFLTAKPGYKYIDGEITNIPAILVVVSEKLKINNLTSKDIFPDTFQDFDVEVVEASPGDILRFQQNHNKGFIPNLSEYMERSTLETLMDNEDDMETFVLGGISKPKGYTPPHDLKLEEVTAAMTIICHVSPEAGWKTLKPFLESVENHLQIAIYDFTAPHINNTIASLLTNQEKRVKMVYDGKRATHLGKGTKVNDIHEDVTIERWKQLAKERFEYIEALKGNLGICNNSYHTKVAIRDKKVFWLSSGNWQSSNQPDIDFSTKPKDTVDYNREWHVVVFNEKLSTIFHNYIDYDFVASSKKPSVKLLAGRPLPEVFIPYEEQEIIIPDRIQLFEPKEFVFTQENPVRIQPVLTPDNYMEHVKELIKSAKHSLYFQNQYITRKGKNITKEYDELLMLLSNATNNLDIDCKILLRTPYSTADRMELLNDLQILGFNMNTIKFMPNTHTKGIIVDGERLLIGSHNWSNSGVEFNRDASLIIYDKDIANYYSEIFEHDWRNRVEKKREIHSLGGENTKSFIREVKMVRVDWDEYFS